MTNFLKKMFLLIIPVLLLTGSIYPVSSDNISDNTTIISETESAYKSVKKYAENISDTTTDNTTESIPEVETGYFRVMYNSTQGNRGVIQSNQNSYKEGEENQYEVGTQILIQLMPSTDFEVDLVHSYIITETESNIPLMSNFDAETNILTLTISKGANTVFVMFSAIKQDWMSKAGDLLESNLSTILIALITCLLILFSKTIIKVYTMGRNSRVELMTRTEFNKYSENMNSALYAQKQDIQQTLTELMKAMLNAKMEKIEKAFASSDKIEEYTTEMKVKLKILDDTNSRLNDMEKQIRKNTENINSLKYPTNTDGRRIDR